MPLSKEELDKLVTQYHQDAMQKASSDEARKLVEKNVASLRDLASETDPEKLAAKTFGLLSSPQGNIGDSPLGVAACQVVLAHGPQGPKIGTEVGTQLVSLRLSQVGANAEGGFVRGGESLNGFSKQFVAQTSPRYESDVKQRLEGLKQTYKEEVESYTNKTKPLLDEIETINKRIGIINDGERAGDRDNKDLTDEQRKERDIPRQQELDNVLVPRKQELQRQIDLLAPERNGIQTRVAKDMLKEMATPPLTDTTKTYLKGLRDGVTNNKDFKQSYVKKHGTEDGCTASLEKIAMDLTNNNTSLRVTVPLLVNDTSMKDHPVWTNSGQAALASFNKFQSDTIAVTEKVPQDVGVALHTPQNRLQVQQMQESIKNAPAPERMGVELGKKFETMKVLEPFDNQIKALEQKQAQLKNNPTMGDKFKAFFKHGLKGVDGEIDRLKTKIEATKIAKDDVEKGVSVEKRQEVVDRLKQNQKGLSDAMQMEKAVVLTNNLEKSGLSTGSTVSEQEVNDALKKHDLLKPAQKELAANIKTQEKVLSVREKLGPKPETKVDAPKQGTKVH